ncbi:bifunctional diaminohydroxyphosphoribosylaminopyrimidine deaminase/5-amino-6-(5-phosphoribosylamino)uracil reductase RibD [Methylocella sp.]|jgi:diaminohydroxyphosphoribosylaminopyrimidine deaminase/5-amino-6-(5-phosphoribosylamino)uracil reductase|uniref:bifunctional diaminohydroxyphosphoribosylaminopyrimidine deaminase/5-amino-6-(5-phosphoribosylamino)uracil reductase RibD n=1 Tax=Methylocella sp. TaxID=1978226 RepID=UPI003C2A0700
MIEADADARFMTAAIALARRGLGLCAPNPPVGALIVKDGAIVARGWTQSGGRPHAETEALNKAGPLARGATLYVTLEPCSHHGKTPPCAEAIVAEGIARVVSALEDPDPRVAGRGHRILEEAGIKVTTNVCAEAARRANLGHMLRVTKGRPMVALKLALTADGFAAGPEGEPRLSITGAVANGYVHMLRAMHDAILVGARTALADNPLLTVRLAGLEARKPLRVVIDSDLKLRLKSRLVETAAVYPVLVIAAEDASAEKEARLAAQGVDVARVRRDEAGHADLGAALEILATRGLTRVFCEGGPTLADALIARGLADEVIVLTSAKPLGREGRAGLSAASLAALADPARYKDVETRMIGEDRLARSERIL